MTTLACGDDRAELFGSVARYDGFSARNAFSSANQVTHIFTPATDVRRRLQVIQPAGAATRHVFPAEGREARTGGWYRIERVDRKSFVRDERGNVVSGIVAFLVLHPASAADVIECRIERGRA